MTRTKTAGGVAETSRQEHRRPSESEQEFSRRLVALILGIDAV